MSTYDVIVLGSGPGGYVTAIRASQLGFKTAVVEKESLGGVCLNWGCIPTKALLKSAQVFDYLKHASDYGLTVKEYDKDFDAVINRSRNVAEGMSKGVQFLMKKNKIDVISGYGTLKRGKKISVKAEDGSESELSAQHIIIATGARSRELPSLPQDGKKVIEISEDQVNNFAGNMLQLKGAEDHSYLVMSQSAFDSLRPAQVQLLEAHATLISSSLHTIETCGGGSARCMMAEVFLPKTPSN